MPVLSDSLKETAIQSLEKINSRLTRSRKLILGVLEHASQPLTVTDIASREPGLVQSSLYRNLTVLEQAKLVTRIVSDHEFAFFELDEHVLGHHHHLRCTQCGSVIDIELDKNIEELLEMATKSIAKKNKYHDVDHNVDFLGICSHCVS